MERQERLPGFVVRVPTEGDAQDVADLVVAYDVATSGSSDYAVMDVRNAWAEPGFVLETDTMLVTTPDGQIVGYAAVNDHGQHARLNADGYVHPAYCGHGIGIALVRWAERRAIGLMALAAAGVRVTLDQGTASSDEAAAALFTREGYGRVRTFWEMAITLASPPQPMWPEGIEVRTFVRDQDERVAYMVAEEAFHDHWGHVTIPFEEWRASRIDHEGFDPSLVFLACDGGEVAGVIRCRLRGEHGVETGWVVNLSVRRPWRGRGLGTALLQHAFATFYRRGIVDVGLGVDAASLTGATRLYERAGMHMQRSFDIYRKVLRDGVEPAG